MDRWNIIKEAIYGVHPVPEALHALQDLEAEIGNLEAENERLILLAKDFEKLLDEMIWENESY